MKRHVLKFHPGWEPTKAPAAKPNKRKIHKRAIVAAEVAVEKNKKNPEPMTLMHKLGKQLDEYCGGLEAHGLPCYRKPMVTLGQIEKAATANAAWNNSDPFAYGRTALHVRQGYLMASEVIKEADLRVKARKVARAREANAMRRV